MKNVYLKILADIVTHENTDDVYAIFSRLCQIYCQRQNNGRLNFFSNPISHNAYLFLAQRYALKKTPVLLPQAKNNLAGEFFAYLNYFFQHHALSLHPKNEFSQLLTAFLSVYPTYQRFIQPAGMPLLTVTPYALLSDSEISVTLMRLIEVLHSDDDASVQAAIKTLITLISSCSNALYQAILLHGIALLTDNASRFPLIQAIQTIILAITPTLFDHQQTFLLNTLIDRLGDAPTDLQAQDVIATLLTSMSAYLVNEQNQQRISIVLTGRLQKNSLPSSLEEMAFLYPRLSTTTKALAFNKILTTLQCHLSGDFLPNPKDTDEVDELQSDSDNECDTDDEAEDTFEPIMATIALQALITIFPRLSLIEQQESIDVMIRLSTTPWDTIKTTIGSFLHTVAADLSSNYQCRIVKRLMETLYYARQGTHRIAAAILLITITPKLPLAALHLTSQHDLPHHVIINGLMNKILCKPDFHLKYLAMTTLAYLYARLSDSQQTLFIASVLTDLNHATYEIKMAACNTLHIIKPALTTAHQVAIIDTLLSWLNFPEPETVIAAAYLIAYLGMTTLTPLQQQRVIDPLLTEWSADQNHKQAYELVDNAPRLAHNYYQKNPLMTAIDMPSADYFSVIAPYLSENTNQQIVMDLICRLIQAVNHHDRHFILGLLKTSIPYLTRDQQHTILPVLCEMVTVHTDIAFTSEIFAMSKMIVNHMSDSAINRLLFSELFIAIFQGDNPDNASLTLLWLLINSARSESFKSMNNLSCDSELQTTNTVASPLNVS